MARTRRNAPTRRNSKAERLEREWERQADLQREKIASEIEAERPPLEPPQVQEMPLRQVEMIRKEAEEIINRRTGTTVNDIDTVVDKASRQPFSVQSPDTDEPSTTAGGLVWWTGGTLDEYIPISQYGDPQRGKDIRAFVLISSLLLNAISILTKKVQALQWTIEGGRNVARKWQRRLNNFENGDGWDFFIARWVRSYSENDKPAYAEIIRAFPSWAVGDDFQLTPRGERAVELGRDKTWEIVDARVMDPVQCFPTTSREFPLEYANSYTGKRYHLRPYQFMSLVDMPSIDDMFPGLGVCGISRAVWAAQEDRMVVRYAMEKMSENPGAGLAIVNTNVQGLRTALDNADADREARGVVYYKGIVFVPVMAPTGGTALEFLSFAGLPDGFNRSEIYNILKEIVATSFGLDVLEFGSIPGRLGTAAQAKVAAAKGRTKSLGAIMQGIERAFRYKLLPESIEFSIKKHDQEEERQRAEIDQIYFENAIRYAQFVPPVVANQYLVDRGAVPNEYPYVGEGVTFREEVADVQAEEAGGKDDPEATEAEAVATGPEGAAEEDTVKRLRQKWGEERIKIDRSGKILWRESQVDIKSMRLWGVPRSAPFFAHQYP